MVDSNSNANNTDGEPLFSTLLAESPKLWGVVDQFVRNLPDRVTAMEDALRNQAFDRLMIIARELGSAGLDHGYDALAERAADIEQAAHDQIIDALSHRIAEMTNLIDRIQLGLQAPGE